MKPKKGLFALLIIVPSIRQLLISDARKKMDSKVDSLKAAGVDILIYCNTPLCSSDSCLIRVGTYKNEL